MSKDPYKETLSGNPWYISDQFAEQLNNFSSGMVIRNRWNIWRKLIEQWWAGHKCELNGNAVNVLDAGCGDGINLMGILNILDGLKLRFSMEGMDYNQLRVEKARVRFPDISITQGDLLNIPFMADRFHIVLCNHVLEHIGNDRRALDELRRVLHPAGLLIVGVPNEGCVLARLRNKIVQRGISTTTDHCHFYTRRSLQARMNDADLSPVCSVRAGFFYPHLRIGNMINSLSCGRAMSRMFGTLIPSQCAELIISCGKNAGGIDEAA